MAVARVAVRLYAELNDFLPIERRQRTQVRCPKSSPSVKHVIEAMGVPHTEVGLVLANGQSVDLSYRVAEGDQISVYPAFRSIDVTAVTRLPQHDPGKPRFVLDAHLGKLAAHLRMLGFDTLYRNDYEDDTLAGIAGADHRILLTRDRALLQRRAVTRGYHVWETDPERQLVEIARRYNLVRLMRPFRRCVHCNGLLAPVAKEAILDRLQPKTRRYYDEFSICADCDRIYWKGSHYEKMLKTIEQLGRERR
jgi:uncharacterized protein with PIN domain